MPRLFNDLEKKVVSTQLKVGFSQENSVNSVHKSLDGVTELDLKHVIFFFEVLNELSHNLYVFEPTKTCSLLNKSMALSI